MRRTFRLTCLAALFSLAVAINAGAAGKDPKDVKFSKEWKGSVADQKLQAAAPDCIAGKKSLEKLWADWKIKDKMPDVDFTKEIVVVGTTVGSRLNLGAKLDDQGNLDVVGVATLDFGEGFRYLLATVSREGVKTVNKKALPKE